MSSARSDHAITVEAALEILDLLAASKDALTLSEVSRKVGMYKSRVYRLIRSLENSGLATRVLTNGRYLLGPKLISLGNAAQRQLNILTYAQPIMEALVKQSKATVILRVLEHDELVAIAIVESPEALKVSYPVGTRNPFYYGASGQVLCAYLPPAVLQRLTSRKRLKKFEKRAVFHGEAFMKELKAVLRRGYAFCNESITGVRSVAVPVLGPGGEVVAALGLGLPKYLFPLKKLQPLVEQAKKAAEQISLALGRQMSTGSTRRGA
jgi:DNA-binding IclR family transcriptional regulator